MGAGLLLASAGVLRIVNLGGFSLWLDEILQTVQTRGSFSEAWLALRRDPDQPALDGLISWLVLKAGAGEIGHRAVHVVWGVLAIVVLATWAARRWSRRVGVVVGLLAAASPFHVRYSQEIRPYALSFLLVVVALYALDRLLDGPSDRDDRSSWTIFVFASVGVVYAHHIATLCLVTTCITWVGARWLSLSVRDPAVVWPAGLGRRLGLAAAVVLLLSLPMLPEKVELFGREARAPAASWTLDAAARRWEALTVAGREGVPLSWAGGAHLALVVVGIGAALRQPIGQRWLLAALLGTVGTELALLTADHWSNARYDLYGWGFLVLLVAVGVDALSRGAARWLRRPAAGAATTVALVCGALGGEIRGLREYYEAGRPQWDRVAELVDELAGGRASLLASNEWSRISIAYYLEGGPNRSVQSVDGESILVERAVQEGGCAIFTVAGYPEFPELEPFLRGHTLLATFPSTGARIYAVARKDGSCPTRLPFRFRREPRPQSLWGVLSRPWHPPLDDRALEFDRATAANLLEGWSTFETGVDATTFVWATGNEASLAVVLDSSGANRLEVRLWPFTVAGEKQTLEPILNGRSLGTRVLEPGLQVVVFPIPEMVLRRGENTVRFRFGHAQSPVGGHDTRQLAVAFDHLEFQP